MVTVHWIKGRFPHGSLILIGRRVSERLYDVLSLVPGEMKPISKNMFWVWSMLNPGACETFPLQRLDTQPKQLRTFTMQRKEEEFYQRNSIFVEVDENIGLTRNVPDFNERETMRVVFVG